MTKHQLEQTLGAVWVANLRGHLYVRADRAAELEYLAQHGALVAVPATATSLAGYAALTKPGQPLASPMRRALA